MNKIAGLVIKNEACADIGTDHGFIPFYLIQNEICPFVILSDIAEGPLEKARDNALSFDISGNYDIRLAPGLSSVEEGEVSTAVIAGMGGELIASILNESPRTAKSIRRLILQPRSRSFVLRKYLENNGFRICGEFLAREAGRISEIILCDKDAEQSEVFESELSYEIAPLIFRDNDKEILIEFVDDKIAKANTVISELTNSDNKEKLAEWVNRSEELKRIRSRL